ncbi:hypothetical protein PAXINDRAFT_13610 [Paxillus involutus ATCC 200175]|uniref:Uncharacterized protein n=1 Tax=Paxillus involutus ATCC 200175 TaxID=664439 RepID=A0A0C9SW48_PAXIN|nr:hypothetical protein PAXINDRAFT_13610 [Paxillus involutus ATCC 200175]
MIKGEDSPAIDCGFKKECDNHFQDLSFVVWTHNMKNMMYNPAFVPQGAPANEAYAAVTLGAGVQWHEAHDAVNQYGRMMVGGASVGGSVGAAGGWLAGGGHSALSPTYGLVQLYLFQANTTNSSALQELTGELLHSQTQFTDDGWGGYGGIINQTLSFFYIAPNMTNETATATTQTWTNYALSLEPWGVTSTTTMYSIPSWYEFYVAVLSTGVQNGANVMITSRLLSQETVANKYKEVARY